nr:vesicle transport v-snare protein vti1 [Quercus suber]
MADSGSELFTNYESELHLLQADLSQKLEQIPSLSGEPRKTLLGAAQHTLDESLELLESMRLEKQNIPASAKLDVNRRFRNADGDLQSAKRKLQSLRSDRQALFGARYVDDPTHEPGDEQVAQREQLLGGTQRLERSSGRLRDSQRIALETEDIGRNTLADLGRQRETIERTRETLLEGEGYTDRSNKTLQGMARRMATNKIVTIAIITVLVLLIIAVIVSKFRTDSRSSIIIILRFLIFPSTVAVVDIAKGGGIIAREKKTQMPSPEKKKQKTPWPLNACKEEEEEHEFGHFVKNIAPSLQVMAVRPDYNAKRATTAAPRSGAPVWRAAARPGVAVSVELVEVVGTTVENEVLRTVTTEADESGLTADSEDGRESGGGQGRAIADDDGAQGGRGEGDAGEGTGRVAEGRLAGDGRDGGAVSGDGTHERRHGRSRFDGGVDGRRTSGDGNGVSIGGDDRDEGGGGDGRAQRARAGESGDE